MKEKVLGLIKTKLAKGRIWCAIEKTIVGHYMKYVFFNISYAFMEGDEYNISIGQVNVSFHIFDRDDFDWFFINNIRGEKRIIEEIAEVAKDEYVLWDIGAHVGTYSCTLGKELQEVVAIEPHPQNIHKLRENLKINDVEYTLCSFALSSNSGLNVIAEGENSRRHEIKNDIGLKNKGLVVVPSVTGDELFQKNISPPDIIKIDVEGKELEVINGLEDTLHNNPPENIFCEIHTGKLSTEEQKQIENKLISAGYQVVKMSESDHQYIIHAEYKNKNI